MVSHPSLHQSGSGLASPLRSGSSSHRKFEKSSPASLSSMPGVLLAGCPLSSQPVNDEEDDLFRVVPSFPSTPRWKMEPRLERDGEEWNDWKLDPRECALRGVGCSHPPCEADRACRDESEAAILDDAGLAAATASPHPQH